MIDVDQNVLHDLCFGQFASNSPGKKGKRAVITNINFPSPFQICAVCLEEFKQKDELGICPCKHAFHRK